MFPLVTRSSCNFWWLLNHPHHPVHSFTYREQALGDYCNLSGGSASCCCVAVEMYLASSFFLFFFLVATMKRNSGKCGVKKFSIFHICSNFLCFKWKTTWCKVCYVVMQNTTDHQYEKVKLVFNIFPRVFTVQCLIISEKNTFGYNIFE